MSNYLGRKPDFTPAVYTRYFERTETRKSPNGHIYFNDEDEVSTNYQIKRDLVFKRLFPSRYADSNNNNNTETEQISQNGNNNSSNNTAQSLGDYISLSNNNSSTHKIRPSSPETDVMLSSSDENDDLLIEERLPTSTHESIVGHIHPRSTIENVRTILIRELYQRTSDSHTEWLKCKMDLPRDYINPKYYADFERRYKKDTKKNTIKKKKSISNANTTENNYHLLDLTTTNEITTTQINNTTQNEDIIETSPIVLPTNSSNQPEFIVLDSDEDEHLNEDRESSYFIDRSSASFTAISQPTITSNEDYQEEDSKYAQLPTRHTSSPSIIRPILSKNQRRKKPNSTNPAKPLVSAIDRIIDQMDQSDTLGNSTTINQQNLLIKEIKKRKKKKKKKKELLESSTN